MCRENSCLSRGLRMLTLAVVSSGILLSAEAFAEPVDFSRDIQPLFAKRCFSCHGPDTHEAGLRLDQMAGATAALDSGSRAIVPGKTAESEILARITSNDPDTQMPKLSEGRIKSTPEVEIGAHAVAAFRARSRLILYSCRLCTSNPSRVTSSEATAALTCAIDVNNGLSPETAAALIS